MTKLHDETQAAAVNYWIYQPSNDMNAFSETQMEKACLHFAYNGPPLMRAIEALKYSHTLCEGDLAVIDRAYLEKSLRMIMEITNEALAEIEAARKGGV